MEWGEWPRNESQLRVTLVYLATSVDSNAFAASIKPIRSPSYEFSAEPLPGWGFATQLEKERFRGESPSWNQAAALHRRDLVPGKLTGISRVTDFDERWHQVDQMSWLVANLTTSLAPRRPVNDARRADPAFMILSLVSAKRRVA